MQNLSDNCKKILIFLLVFYISCQKHVDKKIIKEVKSPKGDKTVTVYWDFSKDKNINKTWVKLSFFKEEKTEVQKIMEIKGSNSINVEWENNSVLNLFWENYLHVEPDLKVVKCFSTNIYYQINKKLKEYYYPPIKTDDSIVYLNVEDNFEKFDNNSEIGFMNILIFQNSKKKDNLFHFIKTDFMIDKKTRKFMDFGSPYRYHEIYTGDYINNNNGIEVIYKLTEPSHLHIIAPVCPLFKWTLQKMNIKNGFKKNIVANIPVGCNLEFVNFKKLKNWNGLTSKLVLERFGIENSDYIVQWQHYYLHKQMNRNIN